MKIERSILASVVGGLCILALGLYGAVLPIFTDIKLLTVQNQALVQENKVIQKKHIPEKRADLSSQEVYQWFQQMKFADLKLDHLAQQDGVLRLQLTGPKKMLMDVLTTLQDSSFSALTLSDLQGSPAKIMIDFNKVRASAHTATPPQSIIAQKTTVLPPPGVRPVRQSLGVFRKNNTCYAIVPQGKKIILRKIQQC